MGDEIQQGRLLAVANNLSVAYGCQAFDKASRSMIELERAYGDIVLFVKRDGSNGTDDEEEDDNTDGLPIEQDAAMYADLPSFQNRLSHHSRFVNGSGFFFIGVHNSDTCLQEDSTFNLTITTVVPGDGVTLCPKNCSFPQGVCVQDNVCKCNPGYGGRYCAGCKSPPHPKHSLQSLVCRRLLSITNQEGFSIVCSSWEGQVSYIGVHEHSRVSVLFTSALKNELSLLL